jgi:hypothetical protein
MRQINEKQTVVFTGLGTHKAMWYCTCGAYTELEPLEDFNSGNISHGNTARARAVRSAQKHAEKHIKAGTPAGWVKGVKSEWS